MKKILTFLFAVMLCLALPLSVWASADTYVIDEAGLLSDAEQSELAEQAALISSEKGIGIYIVTTDDFKLYGNTPYEASVAIYEANMFGIGDDKNGILLFLSMKERDYYLLSHGEEANHVFDDYAQGVIENAFLDDFADNAWHDGFSDYLDESRYFIEWTSEQDDYDTDDSSSSSAFWYRFHIDPFILFISLIPSLIISFFICRALKKKMRSVAEAQKAARYLDKNGVDITLREDRYIRTTVSRTRIVRNNNSGGSGGSSRSSGGGGGGYSGRGGKF